MGGTATAGSRERQTTKGGPTRRATDKGATSIKTKTSEAGYQSSFLCPSPPAPAPTHTPPFLAAYLARTLNVNPPNTHRTPTHCHHTTLCPKTTTEIKMLRRLSKVHKRRATSRDARGHDGSFRQRARGRYSGRCAKRGAAAEAAAAERRSKEEGGRGYGGRFPFVNVKNSDLLSSCARSRKRHNHGAKHTEYKHGHSSSHTPARSYLIYMYNVLTL